jgi:hypothetical protein
MGKRKRVCQNDTPSLHSFLDAITLEQGVNLWLAAAEALVRRHRRLGAAALEDALEVLKVHPSSFPEVI